MTQPPGSMPVPVANAIESNPGGRALFANLLGTPISRAAYGLRWGKIFAPDPVPAEAGAAEAPGRADEPAEELRLAA